MSNSVHIPGEVTRITNALEEAGFQAYLVGGCVRDLLLGLEPKDWDVATDATPDEILGVFDHAHYDNEFGTVRVINDDVPDDSPLKVVEVTTYRLEAHYSDGRRPDSVVFSKHLTDDLKRRDFTINALALPLSRDVLRTTPRQGEEWHDVSKETLSRDVLRKTVVDEFGGLSDLDTRLIKTVGNPNERFNEDALRLLRALRIAVDLDFKIEKKTYNAIAEAADTLKNIAVERIRDEFSKVILSDNPKRGLEMSRETALLQHIIPELEQTFDVEQNKAHSYGLWEHLLRALQAAADKGWSLEIRLAALLHDIGKAPTRRWSEEKRDWTFHGHEVVGARFTKNIMERLHYPKETIYTVVKLVRWHMFFSDPEKITLSAVRRLLRNVGKEYIWDLMDLRVADRVGTGRPKEEPYRLRKYKSMVEEALRDPISVSQLNTDGNTVMEIASLKPGPKIGYILHALLDEVLDNPKKNTTEYLEKRIQELAKLPDDELKGLGERAKERTLEEEEKEIAEIRSKYWVE